MLRLPVRRPSAPHHSTVVAYAALVVALGSGTAFAASAAGLQLGHVNKESSATTIERTKPGPALALKVKPGSPPLSVSSSKVVKNLNADALDGKSASSFQGKLKPLVFTPLALVNGWTGDCFGTGAPGVAVSAEKVVHLQGGICTTGTNSAPFVLPENARPTSTEYLTVDMCDATKGRIIIAPDGETSVQAESDFANAQCFVSLAGVSYTLPY